MSKQIIKASSIKNLYMLRVVDIKESCRHLLPAITHVDGSAILQTVNRKANPFYYDVIKAFGKISGIPVLLNTSFNVAGEPIVETPEDAILRFLGTEIDVLFLNGRMLLR